MKESIFDRINKCNSKEELLNVTLPIFMLETPIITIDRLIIRDLVKRKLAELEGKDNDCI